MQTVLAALVLVAVLGACTASLVEGEQGEPVPITRLRAESYPFAFSSGLSDSLRLVIRDAATWRNTWEQMHRNHSPQPPLPEVDFEREMLIVAALGTRPSGGYGILLESAHEHPSHLVATIRKTSPGAGCVVTAALTQPVDIARLARREKPVHFREIHTVHECR